MICPRYIETVVNGTRTLVCDMSIPVNEYTIFGFKVAMVIIGAVMVIAALCMLRKAWRNGR
jgi:hypothetical protein